MEDEKVPYFEILVGMVRQQCQYCGGEDTVYCLTVSNPYGDCFLFCKSQSCQKIGKYVLSRERQKRGLMWAPRDAKVWSMLGLLKGIPYNVIRSSGHPDEGWVVAALDDSYSVAVEDMPYVITDEVLMYKEIDGKKCVRRCNLSVLVSVNPCMPRDAVAILEREIASLVEESRPDAEAWFQQQAIRVDATDT